MMTEKEWENIYPTLVDDKQFITSKRQEGNLTIREVIDKFETPACKKFYEITGVKFSNPNAIWHHRNSLLGDDCEYCDKPLRTPQAKLCASCGRRKES